MIVNTKKRYDCFQGTDLEITLRTHGINTVLLTGINTNSCVLATACAANVRDFAVIVVEDCVDTMDSHRPITPQPLLCPAHGLCPYPVIP